MSTITIGSQSIIPGASWFLVGADSKRYTVTGIQGIDANQVRVGSEDTGVVAFNITGASWIASFDGLALAGVPGASAMAQGPIPIPGTKYFYVPGRAGTGANLWSVGLRYKITSDVLLEVDGAFAYKYNTGFNFTGGLGTCWCFGASEIGGELFAVCWLYNGVPLFDSAPNTYLLRLPLSYGANIIESNMAVWPTRRTDLLSVFGPDVSGYMFAGQLYFNRCTILKHPNANSVMILTYRAAVTVPGTYSALTTAGSESLVVDYSAQTLGLLINRQAELGQPWTDVALGYAGAPTVNNQYNDYSAPTYNPGTDPTMRELIFGRPFVDQVTINRLRRFTYDETADTFTTVDTNDFIISGSGESSTDRGVLAPRDGTTLYGARYDTTKWALGVWTFPTPPTEANRRWFLAEPGPIRVIS